MKQVERILKEVALLSQHRETGFTRHYRGNVRLGKPARLQIASFENVDGFYLYYLDEHGQEQSDTYHDSINDAMEQARSEFGVTPGEWIEVSIERCYEVDPDKEARFNRIRKALSEGASHVGEHRGESSKLAKVFFQLPADAISDTESLWAEPLGAMRYRLQNVPFYLKGYSYDDVVLAYPNKEGTLLVRDVYKGSQSIKALHKYMGE